MFKKGDNIECIDRGDRLSIELGSVYKVVVDAGTYLVTISTPTGNRPYRVSRFRLYKPKVSEKSYTLKLSSPDLLDYQRMYDETMVDGVRVAKVTIKAEGKDDAYLLMVHDRIWDKAGLQKGGDEIVRQLDVLGVSRYEAGPLTIKVWASAYELVKRLVKLPLLPEFKAETVVIVEPLEV